MLVVLAAAPACRETPCCYCCVLLLFVAAVPQDTHPKGCVIPVALAQGLNAQAASSTQHGPAAVDDLALCEALQALRVLAQTQGVKAVVAVERGGAGGCTKSSSRARHTSVAVLLLASGSFTAVCHWQPG